MECTENEFGWCVDHDVPFIEWHRGDVIEHQCASEVGIDCFQYSDSPLRRMYSIGAEYMQANEDLQSEIRDLRDHECDHDDCYSADHVEDIIDDRIGGFLYEEKEKSLYEILEALERGEQLTDLDLRAIRNRVGPFVNESYRYHQPLW